MYNPENKKADIDRAFSEAVMRGDIPALQEIFKEGNSYYPHIDQELVTAPAILLAALRKDWDMVEALYELNASLDVKTLNNSWYLLHECVKSAPDYILSAVAEYGDVNVSTDDGRTPLMVALKEGKLEAANMLLDTQRVHLNSFDKQGNTAAHYAALYGHQQLFMRFIKEGIDLQRKNKKGEYAADLIEDQFFKSQLPEIQEKVAKEESKASVEQGGENTQTQDKEKTSPGGAKPAVSGLSKIKKKF